MHFIDSITCVSNTISPPAPFEYVAVAGDSLILRPFPKEAKAWICDVSANVISNPVVISSIRFHDITNPITVANFLPSASYVPHGFEQLLRSNDTLQVKSTDAPVADVSFYLTMHLVYENLQNMVSRYMSPSTVKKQFTGNLKTVLSTVNASVSKTAFTACTQDFKTTIKSNMQYALIGFINTGANLLTTSLFRLQSEETGNLKIAFPQILPSMSQDYFIRLSRRFNMPLIPYFDGINMTTIVIDALAPALATDQLTLIFAEMKPV